jgi:four helix bundle protein
MKDFRELKVWQKAHELTLKSYKVTANFPREEMFGLSSQIRRAAASMPANIAEGCGRGGDAEFGRFLQIAMGSASELEYHFLLSRDLNFLSSEEYLKLESEVIEVKKMLSSLILRIKNKPV